MKFELVINLKYGEANRRDDSAVDADEGGQGDQVILDFRLPIFDFGLENCMTKTFWTRFSDPCSDNLVEAFIGFFSEIRGEDQAE